MYGIYGVDLLFISTQQLSICHKDQNPYEPLYAVSYSLIFSETNMSIIEKCHSSIIFFVSTFHPYQKKKSLKTIFSFNFVLISVENMKWSIGCSMLSNCEKCTSVNRSIKFPDRRCDCNTFATGIYTYYLSLKLTTNAHRRCCYESECLINWNSYFDLFVQFQAYFQMILIFKSIYHIDFFFRNQFSKGWNPIYREVGSSELTSIVKKCFKAKNVWMKVE